MIFNEFFCTSTGLLFFLKRSSFVSRITITPFLDTICCDAFISLRTISPFFRVLRSLQHHLAFMVCNFDYSSSPMFLPVFKARSEASFITFCSHSSTPSIWGRINVDQHLPFIIWKMMFSLICLDFQGVWAPSVRSKFKNVGCLVEKTTICQVFCIRFIFS